MSSTSVSEFSETSCSESTSTGSQRKPQEGSARLWVMYGSAMRQGERPTMEDTAVILDPCELACKASSPRKIGQERRFARRMNVRSRVTEHVASSVADRLIGIFAIYDGHGGHDTSEWLQEHLHVHVCEAIADLSESHWSTDMRRKMALCSAFEKTEELWFKVKHKSNDTRVTSGSTALLVVITKDNKAYIANVGDCRAILVRDSRVVTLSRDQTPQLAAERKRVTERGGRIRQGMVQGVLQMTRAFGDFELKSRESLHTGVVVATPDVKHIHLDTADRFIFIATDGVWDVLSNKQVASIVNKKLKQVEKSRDTRLADACDAVVEAAIKKGSTDNTSCVLCGLFWA